VARGELGWMPMKARRDSRQLKYWGNILKMDDSRLVKQIYRQCKTRTSSIKGSFCYSVKKLLESLGLGHLWTSEQIGELKDWVSLMLASVKQKDKEIWLAALQKKSKLRLYRVLKSDLQINYAWKQDVGARNRRQREFVKYV